LINSKLLDMKRNPLSIRKTILILLVFFMSGSTMAQKINLNTLDINQLNLYKDKAVKMRNTGRVLSLSGIGVMVPCIIIGVISMNEINTGPDGSPEGPPSGLFYVGLVGVIGTTCTVVGIPLWAVGGSRMAKAELTLQKFTLAPENSMAVGMGITLRF
jgi:hypothetical protein